MSLVTQAHANIRLPHGVVVPISAFFLTVAETGERKSAVDSKALEAVRDYQKILRIDYEEEFESWKINHAVWKKQRGKILGDNKKGEGETKDGLEHLGKEPKPPIQPVILAGEPTMQGLFRQFQDGQMSAGLFNDEAGSFVGGYAFSDEQKLQSGSHLSSLWDGKEISRPRAATEGYQPIPNKRLAIHLMIQPGVANRLLGDGELRDQGFLSRVLTTAPEPVAGKCMWKEPSPYSETSANRFNDRMKVLLEKPPKLVEGRDNELNPDTMELDADAREILIGFYNVIQVQIRPGGDCSEIKGLANKAMEHAARIAATLAVFFGAATVNKTHMIDGTKIVQYYLTEAIRIRGNAQISMENLIAKSLLDWLHQSEIEFIHPVAVYQSGPSNLRDRKAAQATLKVLEDHRWLVRVDGGMVIDGKQRKSAWRVVQKEAANVKAVV